MTAIAAIGLCLTLGALALFQLSLIAGAPLGRFAWGGAERVLPAKQRIASAVAIVLYGLFAWVHLMKADLAPPGIPEIIIDVAAWVIAAYLVLGIAMNALSKSPRERWTMTPISTVLAALAGIVALS